jgi:hypothetical protein
MNSLTIWLYVASGVVIGLLSAFAIHNRRSGWKKSRTTLAEALDDLYADLGLSVDLPQEPERSHLMVARREETPVDPSDFSDQLIRLTKALGEAATVKPNEAMAGENARARELAKVQFR